MRTFLQTHVTLMIVSCSLLGGCKTDPPLAPASVHKDREFTEFFRRTSGWTAGDGAFSVPLSDGRVLWLFGDSYIDHFDTQTGTVPCLFQVRNAAMLQARRDDRQVSTLVGQSPAGKSLFVHPTDAKLWFWPECGFQRGDDVFVYLIALERTPAGGMLGFKVVAHFWARMKFPEMVVTEYIALPDFSGIDFGRGFISEGRYTYAFGGKQEGLGSKIYVARFNTGNPERDWNFWDGQTWNSGPTKAAIIGRGASTSVHVCKVRNKFLLTTSAFSVGCDQGKDIFVATGSKPTGPFSALKKIFSIDDFVEGHLPFFYLPVAHPEFINEKNELLITYSINGYEPCVPSCVNGRMNPDYYRPRAIRVPLSMLDPTLH